MSDVISILGNGELLVYRYIEEESQKHGGTLKESVDSIAENILQRYPEDIPERSRRGVKSKTFSSATVSRALNRLKEQGIIQVVKSNDSSSPNEIIFYGSTDEQEQVSEIVNMAQQLNLSLSRFETVLKTKDKENHQLTIEKKQLYKELDQKNEEIRRLSKLVGTLQEDLQKLSNGDNPFSEGKILHTLDLADGQRAYVVSTD